MDRRPSVARCGLAWLIPEQCLVQLILHDLSERVAITISVFHFQSCRVEQILGGAWKHLGGGEGHRNPIVLAHPEDAVKVANGVVEVVRVEERQCTGLTDRTGWWNVIKQVHLADHIGASLERWCSEHHAIDDALMIAPRRRFVPGAAAWQRNVPVRREELGHQGIEGHVQSRRVDPVMLLDQCGIADVGANDLCRVPCGNSPG